MSPPAFRTVLPISASPPALAHHEPLLFLGSCFSDEVGSRLRDRGHRVCINPLGTIFNPASLSATVQAVASGKTLSPEDVRYCERTGLFYSFEAGSTHAHEKRDVCTSSINDALNAGRHALQESAALFLTLGSAWAYVHREGPDAAGGIVVNNHRQPHAEFERKLLSVEEATQHLAAAVDAARQASPSLRKIVLTVSPVRHTREGLVESSRSKAHLLAACHAVCEQQQQQQRQQQRSATRVGYFPAYELLLDELRDYRWFAEDMLHPSHAAAEYVTTRVLESHFDAADDGTRAAVGALRAAARHRHTRPGSAAARAFAEAQRAKCAQLEADHPHLAASGALRAEAAHFERMARGKGGSEP